MHEGQYAEFVGLDVGKGEHHAFAVDIQGSRCTTNPWPRTKHESARCWTG